MLFATLATSRRSPVHLNCDAGQEGQMAQLAELDAAPTTTAPDTIEATLNYIVDDGTKVFTIVATPGGSDARSGGTPDPRRVKIHNGRPHVKEFDLETNGFRFVDH